jgi:hypothetical protein
MPRSRRAFLAMFVPTLVAGCASMRRSADTSADAATMLKVDNQAFLDMTIYLIVGTQRVRLGTATGNMVTRLRIPSRYIFGPTPLQFLADPIGGNRTPVSDTITVVPGDEVTLVIPPNA